MDKAGHDVLRNWSEDQTGPDDRRCTLVSYSIPDVHRYPTGILLLPKINLSPYGGQHFPDVRRISSVGQIGLVFTGNRQLVYTHMKSVGIRPMVILFMIS